MIDLKSALDSVKYNTGFLNSSSNSEDNTQQPQQGQNTGVLASILKKIAPTVVSGGSVPPVA